MSGLCKVFGHKRNAGWWGDGLYGVLRGPTTDGTGREHYTVTLECDRCGERYLAARFHGPLTTPPARSYADGVEFEEAATIADAFAAGQQRMIDEEGPDEACRGGKEVSEFIANAIRRRASIRLLSQEPRT